MEQEKIKETKKALDCMSGLCKDSLSNICFECEIDKKFDEESTCKEALTLINELESENEKLKQHKQELQGGQQDLVRTIKAQHERIAELEKQMCKNEDLHKSTENLNNVILKQFVERLKEKDVSVPLHEEFIIIDKEVIDKTLKEFMDE